MKRICGSHYYIAPEILLNEGYDSQCDLWSLGVVVYTCLTGHFPFDSSSIENIFHMIVNERVAFSSHERKVISKKARTFIRKLMTRDVGSRLTAD